MLLMVPGGARCMRLAEPTTLVHQRFFMFVKEIVIILVTPIVKAIRAVLDVGPVTEQLAPRLQYLARVGRHEALDCLVNLFVLLLLLQPAHSANAWSSPWGNLGQRFDCRLANLGRIIGDPARDQALKVLLEDVIHIILDHTAILTVVVTTKVVLGIIAPGLLQVLGKNTRPLLHLAAKEVDSSQTHTYHRLLDIRVIFRRRRILQRLLPSFP
mmetsp:Transcript_7162/g.12992  ORF Transcript_7162/g.12992 Transcript_7162/m.12992 type:complete len:213 (+) Transcript_7162:337-975(+)